MSFMHRLRHLGDSLTFQVLMVAIATRLALLFTNWFGLKAVPRLPVMTEQRFDWLIPDHPSIDGFARWDTAWYVKVAMDWYEGPAGEPVQHRGFFPLYPLTIRIVEWLTGHSGTVEHFAIAAVIAANLAFLVAVPLFARIMADRYSPDVALTATILFCVSPLSFFFSAGYSESLFLLCVLLAFFFAYRRQWFWAAVAIALTTATRLTGLALVPAILLVAWRHRARLRDYATIIVIGPLGVLSYFLWMWWQYDDFFAYSNAQTTFWGDWQDHVGQYRDRLLNDPLSMVDHIDNAIISVNVTLALIGLISLIWVWQKVEPGMALFTTIMVVFHFAWTWHSLGRYVLPALGTYIVIALWLERPGWKRWLRQPVILASTILMTLFMIMFAHGFWLV